MSVSGVCGCWAGVISPSDQLRAAGVAEQRRSPWLILDSVGGISVNPLPLSKGMAVTQPVTASIFIPFETSKGFVVRSEGDQSSFRDDLVEETPPKGTAWRFPAAAPRCFQKISSAQIRERRRR